MFQKRLVGANAHIRSYNSSCHMMVIYDFIFSSEGTHPVFINLIKYPSHYLQDGCPATIHDIGTPQIQFWICTDKVKKSTKSGHVSINDMIIYLKCNIIIFHEFPMCVVEIFPRARISEGGKENLIILFR